MNRPLVHFGTTHIKIPVSGTYTVHVDQDSNFSGGYAINMYDGSFDATQPCNFFTSNGSVNSDMTTHLTGGQSYTIVVSSNTPGVATGDYAGSISTAQSCTLP